MDYLIFIPFIIFFPLYSYSAHLKIKANDKKSIGINWIKDNIFSMLRIDILLLLGIFIYFASHKNITVDRMLFFMIYLYLFINTLYEIPKKEKITSNVKIIIFYLILTIIPIIYYILTKNFIITCYIMCAFTFLAYIIVMIINTIIKKTSIRNHKLT